MTHEHQPRAERVVNAFKQKLSQSGRDHVGDRHFDELTLMIESAISTAVLEKVEHAADLIHDVVESIRKDAEHL
jgi:hypothetical protein